ncbi:MAG: SpoIIIAH-like family protein [Clostridia bacterium]|nr:SpoIIIAH-like family protein [Clostridia bacterium]
MKIIKRNQIIIFVIALMLITAGYLNYTTGDGGDLVATSSLVDSEKVAGIGDAKLVSSNAIEGQDSASESLDNTNMVSGNDTTNTVIDEKNNVNSSKSQNENKTVTTSGTVSKETDEYFTNSRLTRDTMYSQMIESYQKILDNNSISADQKAISQTEIKKINDLKNSIMICENLIKTKGFKDVVIFVNDISISVIIKADAEQITGEGAAQIQNIVAREMKAEIENIHISNK